MVNSSIITDIRKLQLAELEILKELDRVCNKLNIQYYLFSGTLLGAVRHRGFIPWDDDIDIIMFRDEYNRFKKEAFLELNERFFLQTLDTDEGYPHMHTKLRDSTTTFIEEGFANLKMNHGIYIDIFPMDGTPDNLFLRKFGWKILSIIGLFAMFKTTSTREVTVKGKLFKLFVNSVPISGRFVAKIYVNLCALVDIRKSKVAAFSAWPYDPLDHIIYPKEWFDDTVMLEFEGLMFPAPAKHHLILTHLFHDYLKMPPEEKRIGHKTTIVSVNIPYTEFLLSRNTDKL